MDYGYFIDSINVYSCFSCFPQQRYECPAAKRLLIERRQQLLRVANFHRLVRTIISSWTLPLVTNAIVTVFVILKVYYFFCLGVSFVNIKKFMIDCKQGLVLPFRYTVNIRSSDYIKFWQKTDLTPYID